MAHFAKIDKNNLVTEVLVTNDEMPNEGYDWLVENLGGTWIKTSYNTIGGIHTQGGTPLRKNFAGIGMTYDASRDAFIPPKPFESWILNEDTCLWEAPIVMPSDGLYVWNEDLLNWDAVEDAS